MARYSSTVDPCHFSGHNNEILFNSTSFPQTLQSGIGTLAEVILETEMSGLL
jgi:hypothetical protein